MPVLGEIQPSRGSCNYQLTEIKRSERTYERAVELGCLDCRTSTNLIVHVWGCKFFSENMSTKSTNFAVAQWI